MNEKERLREAIRCCKGEGGAGCKDCPLQDEICDDLIVNMIDVPLELLDRIEEELI